MGYKYIVGASLSKPYSEYYIEYLVSCLPVTLLAFIYNNLCMKPMTTIANTHVHIHCTSALGVFNTAKLQRDQKRGWPGYRNRPENVEQKLELLKPLSQGFSRNKRGRLGNWNRSETYYLIYCRFVGLYLPRACMRSRGRVFGLSVSLFVCLFVCQFVHHFLSCLRVQGILKGFLYTQQVDQVEKVAYRWSAIEKNGLEASKTLVLTRG